MTIAEKAFRELREQWFNLVLQSRPHQREWEKESEMELREKLDLATKIAYDQDTEAILRGEDLAVSPRCYSELVEGRKMAKREASK